MIKPEERADIHHMRDAARRRLSRMEELVDTATIEGRDLTPAEDREYRELSTELEQLTALIRREEQRRTEADGGVWTDRYDFEPAKPDARTMPVTGGRAGGLWRALQQAGWDLRSSPSVTVSLREALPSTFPDPATYSPRPAGDIVPMPADSRYLWAALGPAIDIGTDTSVSDFRQVAREVTGTVERDLDATDDKATLSLGIEHVVAEVRQLAVILADVPSVVLESLPTAQRFFETEATRVLNQAIDQHVYSQILAANPPQGDQGADLIQKVRYAVAAMRSAGGNPAIAAFSPAGAVELDLAQQPGDAGDYVFPSRQTGSSSPLWGLTIVEAPIVTDPLLIDPATVGQLYLGNLSVLVDPYSKLAKNLVDVRFEMRLLFHVRSAFGAYVIAESTGDGDGA